MFKIKPTIIFGLNILLVLASWICYKYPHGDEYLVLFMISLIFMVAPFAMSVRLIVGLLAFNLAFFIFYLCIGVLNRVDVAVLLLLFTAASGVSALVGSLISSFDLYYKFSVTGKQKVYNGVVGELESVDRRGRKVENEMSRMSRLYEITKRLVPTLTFEDLVNVTFDFLEENFKFRTMHLVIFDENNIPRSIAKTVGEDDYYEDEEMVLDHDKVVDHLQGKEFKPFFLDRDEEKELFAAAKVRSDTFMVFPLFAAERLCAVLAIEGASRTSYGRFRLLVPQIVLELRKVELYEQVQKLSIIDGLTEVYLRRYLMDRLEEEVERAGRLGLTFSVGMVDIDRFKECNDKYGHMVGDAILKKVAGRLKKSVREVDMIARYGGEEFCIVLPETSKKIAATVAERLRSTVASKEIKAFDEKIRSTVSIGIATYPEDAQDVTSLIDKADMALYKAKRNGRNAVCVA